VVLGDLDLVRAPRRAKLHALLRHLLECRGARGDVGEVALRPFEVALLFQRLAGVLENDPIAALVVREVLTRALHPDLSVEYDLLEPLACGRHDGRNARGLAVGEGALVFLPQIIDGLLARRLNPGRHTVHFLAADQDARPAGELLAIPLRHLPVRAEVEAVAVHLRALAGADLRGVEALEHVRRAVERALIEPAVRHAHLAARGADALERAAVVGAGLVHHLIERREVAHLLSERAQPRPIRRRQRRPHAAQTGREAHGGFLLCTTRTKAFSTARISSSSCGQIRRRFEVPPPRWTTAAPS
jgi:hypothetical protein